MMESFLVDGRQDVGRGDALVYGQSITDACLGWDATVPAAPRPGRRGARAPAARGLTARTRAQRRPTRDRNPRSRSSPHES